MSAPGVLGGGFRRTALVGEDRLAGLAWARAWRLRNKAYFDALYGPDGAGRGDFCPGCGRRR